MRTFSVDQQSKALSSSAASDGGTHSGSSSSSLTLLTYDAFTLLHAGWVLVGITAIILMCFVFALPNCKSGTDVIVYILFKFDFVIVYVGMPCVHRWLFSQYYEDIPCLLDFHFGMNLLLMVTVSTMIGNLPTYWLFIVALFLLVNICATSSCCNHFSGILEACSCVEEEFLLSLDDRRKAIQFALVDNLEVLKSIAGRFEILIHAELGVCILTTLLTALVSVYVEPLNDIIDRILIIILLTYRNFLFVTRWNSYLHKLEDSQQLRFDLLKIRFLGQVITSEMLIAAAVVVLGGLAKGYFEQQAAGGSGG